MPREENLPERRVGLLHIRFHAQIFPRAEIKPVQRNEDQDIAVIHVELGVGDVDSSVRFQCSSLIPGPEIHAIGSADGDAHFVRRDGEPGDGAAESDCIGPRLSEDVEAFIGDICGSDADPLVEVLGYLNTGQPDHDLGRAGEGSFKANPRPGAPLGRNGPDLEVAADDAGAEGVGAGLELGCAAAVEHAVAVAGDVDAEALRTFVLDAGQHIDVMVAVYIE
jgi:hypothetical protein